MPALIVILIQLLECQWVGQDKATLGCTLENHNGMFDKTTYRLLTHKLGFICLIAFAFAKRSNCDDCVVKTISNAAFMLIWCLVSNRCVTIDEERTLAGQSRLINILRHVLWNPGFQFSFRQHEVVDPTEMLEFVSIIGLDLKQRLFIKGQQMHTFSVIDQL